jgi:hypothetical protein
MRQQADDTRCVCSEQLEFLARVLGWSSRLEFSAGVLGWSSRLEFTQVCTEAMATLVRIFAASEHGQSAELLKGILRHI